MTSLASLNQVKEVWNLAQRPMKEVERWGNFSDYSQTLVEHSNSLPFVLMWVMNVLQERCTEFTLDYELVMTCVQVHDMGEPLTGGDEHYDIKTSQKDIDEWVAFMDKVEQLPVYRWREKLKRAFALQYCRKPTDIQLALPEEGRKLINELMCYRPLEAATFEFCERLDYIFSAVKGHEQGVKNHTETMLVHTLDRQIPRLDRLVSEFSEFRIVWTSNLRYELLDLKETSY